MTTDIRVIRSKKLMVNAYIDLLKTNEPSTIKINQICEKAGVSRPTFYKHYKEKSEILTGHLSDLFHRYFDIVKKKNYHEKKATLLFFRICEKEWEFFKTTLQQQMDYEILNRLKGAVQDHIDGMTDSAKQLFKKSNQQISGNPYSLYSFAGKVYMTIVYWAEHESLNYKQITQLYLNQP